MSESALLYNYLLVGAVLFGIGLVGFLVRRNLIVMFLSVEIMLQGVSLSMVAWGRYHNDWGGQMMVLMIIAIAACEAAIALALILIMAKQTGVLDVTRWETVREGGRPPFVDSHVPEEEREAPLWPSLTPAGIEPEVDEEEELYRSRV